MLIMIGYDATLFRYADATLKADRDFTLAAVQKHGKALKYVNNNFKKDRDIVLAALKEVFTPSDIYYSKRYTKADLMNDIHPDLKKDKDFVLAALQKDGNLLEYADAELRRDKDVVLAAIKTENAFQYADDSLKRDKDFVLTAMNEYSNLFEYADASLKGDKSFVLAAVQKEKMVLKYADDFKGDKDIVVAAVRRDNLALSFVEDKWQQDKDVLKAAIENVVKECNWSPINAFYETHPSLKKNRDFMFGVVKQDASWFKGACGDDWSKDREFTLAATEDNSLLFYVDDSLTTDRDFVLEAVRKNGLVLHHANKQWKEDKQIVLAAVEQNGMALKYAADKLNSDRDVVIAAVKQNREALEIVSYRKDVWKDQDIKKIVEAAVNKDCENPGYSCAQRDKDKRMLERFSKETPLYDDLGQKSRDLLTRLSHLFQF